MMRRFNSYIYLLVMIVLGTPAFANTAKYNLLQVGLQGGGTYHFVLSESMMQGGLGASGAFSFEIAHYKSHPTADLGFKTGFSLGFQHSAYKANFQQKYSNCDYYANQIDYTTSGQVHIQQQQVFATLPLLFALYHRGVTWNIGMRFQVGLYEMSKQQLSNPVILAYYPAYGVHVTNELITGRLVDDLPSQSINRYSMTLNALVSTEIGYEHRFSANSALGVLLYCNVGIWDKLPEPTHEPIIQVDPITDPLAPVPSVTINDAQSSLLSSTIPLQLGLKLYYAFTL